MLRSFDLLHLMTSVVRDIPFGDLEEGFPALLTVTLVPLMHGAAAFVIYFALPGIRPLLRS